MSRMSWPNRITIARILLIAPFVICLLNVRTMPGARWAALAIFVVMALSDAFDGFLARRLGQETPLGRFLDPLADKLLITCTVILLALPNTWMGRVVLPSWVAVIAIGKDLVVLLGFVLIYLSVGKAVIQPRRLGKICTACQLVMVVLVLLSPDRRPDSSLGVEVPGMLMSGVWWTASALAVASALDYVRMGSRFVADAAHAEPPT